MQIKLLKKNKFYKYSFPTDDVTKYWIYDRENDCNLIALERRNNEWYIVSNEKCSLEYGEELVDEDKVELNTFYNLKANIGGKIFNAILLITKTNDTNIKTYKFINDGMYSIGTGSLQNIILNNQYVNKEHAIITKNGTSYEIKSANPESIVYVNDVAVYEKKINNGDIVFIYGFKFIFINDKILINNFNNGLTINNPNIKELENNNNNSINNLLKTEDDDSAILYEESEYFSRAPRFVTTLVDEDFKIDSPPGKVEPDDTPILYTVGPMLTMSMSSIVSASTSIINLQRGQGTLLSVLPALVISVAMLASTLLWPTLTRKFQRKKQKKKEEERQEKYINYLKEKKIKIENIRVNQMQVLTEYYPGPEKLSTIIMYKKRNLWERLIDSDDFLNVRVGLGTIPLKIKLNYSKEDFTMAEDNLKDELNNVVESAKDIENAPLVIDLIERNKLVIMGDNYAKDSMLKNIILQVATYHAYSDLKMVFFVDDNFNNIFDNFKTLPHLWTNSRDIRFYADNYDDMTKLSFYLEQTWTARKSENNSKQETMYKNFSPYYLIIIDNIKKAKNIEIVKKVLEENNNLGFGLIILSDGISELPNECNDFLTASFEKSAIIKNDLNKDNQQTFIMDSMLNVDVELLSEKLSNIPIKLPLMLDELKSSLGFLEMYKVGNVEQLNINDKWINNNPVNSLSVPIGIHTDGEIFSLDLHEKFHGPHGLIAGMTGSGKSEFIITYILSMCLNFNPLEVSFVLIDYKGGGLTGAFENKSKGIKLPHLAGVITNLDKAEINRCLASIESELKRRQQLFNKAKDELNESTIDIYKYQKLYRDGMIKEPISHLFIITDEFAELKSQQPEFMNELISAARIGRSLGVHLILATQKPSGIVDDQIWSNSKFKVCLKVQEKSDSMDVIKTDAAAMLKKAGRFYLQVGYNDYFAMGQSAYTGTKYIPRENIAKTVDRSISFINNIGDTIKTVETGEKIELVSFGEELPNILNYICKNAKEKNLEASKLWLDAIPSEIFVNNLINKYRYFPKKWDIKAVVGEYDVPTEQRQDLLTIDFNNSGNTLIYGVEGKEIFIVSMIYSLIMLHSPYEINIYVIDFGSESLGMFKKAPQVGDVVYITEKEKLVNLFNKLSRELDQRKKIFTEYNGDYNIYIKNSGKTVPRLIIVINNYEMLSENYDDFVDIIASLSREGEKYGITFVISATGVNAIRGKTTQNFGNVFGLQFNDPSDYSSILGSTRGLIPMDIVGRGLTKVNGALYEFQTAYAYKWDEITIFIKNICDKLASTVQYEAETINVLPNFVRLNNVINKISNLQNVPIGIQKNNLNISTFNFEKNPISLVSCQDPSLLDNFIPSLCQVLQKINNLETIVVDSSEVIKDRETFKNYYGNDSSMVFEKFKDVLNSNSNIKTIFVINGFDTFMNGLTKTNKLEMENMLSKLKEKPNIKVVIADSVSKIKQYEYNEFYRNNVQALFAIWLGSGITDQYTIKNSSYSRETRAQLENNFGWNVNRGISSLIKVLDFYSKDDD